MTNEEKKAYHQKYQKEHPEKYKEANKRWREKNPERHRAYAERYRAANKEKVYDYQKAYREKNREKINEKRRANRQRKVEETALHCLCLQAPTKRDLVNLRNALRVTQGKLPEAKPLSEETTAKLLNARHSPIRLLPFLFFFQNIPSNTATHLCRHVHAQPFVSTLRGDIRQELNNPDLLPRNTPVNMLFYVNAEELMVIANKRLCAKAAPATREAVAMMCNAAKKAFPVIAPFLVPMCDYCGGVCHEINPCGRCNQ